MKTILGIFFAAVLGALFFLGILIFHSFAVPEAARLAPVSDNPQHPVSTMPSSASSAADMVLKSTHSVAKVVPEAKLASPQSTPEPEPLAKPVFYDIKPEKIANLSGEQQWALKRTQESYISYYNDWMKTYPRDTNLWNEKMKDFEQDLVLKLGPDGADQLLH